MSDELKAAAERLDRIFAGAAFGEVYPHPVEPFRTTNGFSTDAKAVFTDWRATHPADGSPDAAKAECDRLREENLRLRKINAHVPPRIMIAAKEAAGFGTAIITDWTVCDPTIVDATEAKFARLVNNIKCLRKYVLVEGRPSFADDCDKMIGFAYEAQQWAFAANPEYEAHEALEKCEKWLHASLDEMLRVVGVNHE